MGSHITSGEQYQTAPPHLCRNGQHPICAPNERLNMTHDPFYILQIIFITPEDDYGHEKTSGAGETTAGGGR